MDRSSTNFVREAVRALAAVFVSLALAAPCIADPFFFSNGGVDGRMATASRPGNGTIIETETADDFVTTAQTTVITAASFIGLLPPGFSIAEVVVEIYRVFPLDSTDPPSGRVPTRVNSPSDVAFASRDSAAASELAFVTSILNANFTAANSVVNGINPKPNQNTLGEGPVTGEEVEFSVLFSQPFALPAGHYFFVPQVLLSGNGGNFLWLSSTRPIVPPGTPFAPDLQSWIRNANLDPDWLRIGTDIVGGTTPPTFNAAFTLTGATVAEPSTLLLLALGLIALGWRRGSPR